MHENNSLMLKHKNWKIESCKRQGRCILSLISLVDLWDQFWINLGFIRIGVSCSTRIVQFSLIAFIIAISAIYTDIYIFLLSHLDHLRSPKYLLDKGATIRSAQKNWSKLGRKYTGCLLVWQCHHKSVECIPKYICIGPYWVSKILVLTKYAILVQTESFSRKNIPILFI